MPSGMIYLKATRLALLFSNAFSGLLFAGNVGHVDCHADSIVPEFLRRALPSHINEQSLRSEPAHGLSLARDEKLFERWEVDNEATAVATLPLMRWFPRVTFETLKFKEDDPVHA